MNVMTERPSRTWKTRAAVLAGWLVLIALLAAYHYWLTERGWHRLWPPPRPLFPVWLLVVDVGAIVGGLVLACTRWLPGRTPMRRYWVSVCVGVVCAAAMWFLLYDVWLHVGMRIDIICG